MIKTTSFLLLFLISISNANSSLLEKLIHGQQELNEYSQVRICSDTNEVDILDFYISNIKNSSHHGPFEELQKGDGMVTCYYFVKTIASLNPKIELDEIKNGDFLDSFERSRVILAKLEKNGPTKLCLKKHGRIINPLKYLNAIVNILETDSKLSSNILKNNDDNLCVFFN